MAETAEDTVPDAPAEPQPEDRTEPRLSVDIEMSDHDGDEKPSGVTIRISAFGGRGTSAARLAAAAYHELAELLQDEAPAGG